MRANPARLQKILGSTGFLRYVKNTSWLFGEKLLSMGISFIVGVWVAHYLGPSQLGVLTYGQSFAAFLIVMARFGMDSILIRNLVEQPEAENRLLGSAFVIHILSAGLGMLLLLGVLYVISLEHTSLQHEPIKNYVIITICSGAFFQAFHIIDYVFQGRVEARHGSRIRLIQLILVSVLKVGLIFVWKGPVLAFAGIILLADILVAIGMVWVYQHQFGNILEWRFDLRVAGILVKDAYPLVLSAFTAIFYIKIDGIMITNMLGDAQNGVYSIAVRLTEIWYVFPGIICNSLFPAIVNAKKNSHETYLHRTQSLYDLLFVLALCIALPTTLLGSWLEWGISQAFGPEYLEAASVLRVQIWSSVLVFLGVASNYWLISENLQKIGLYRILMGAVINVVMNYFLLPRYGIMGAAYATLVSQLFASYLGYLVSKKTWLAFRMLSRTLTFRSLPNTIKNLPGLISKKS